jgi:NADP-dependent 3-hydroxy acid dehydrogenase YdfG
MMDRLQGTVALVTGASSGIGEATARRLAAQGARIALVARRRDRLERIAAELDGAHVIQADVSDREQGTAAVGETVSELGRLDVLVNNAGVMLNGPVEGAPIEEWERMVSLNVLGLLYVTHAALPHLLAAADQEPRRVADIVNISSTAGRFAYLNAAVYNATKFGVGAFSESFRQEVTRRHVRVSLVEPGGTDTELFGHQRPEIVQFYEERFKDVELLHADDIADAVEYIVTRPRRVAVNELLIRPSEQV